MKIKIIFITFIACLISVVIYNYTKKDEINIVALGDGVALGMTPYNIEGYSYNNYLKEEYQNSCKLANYYEFTSFGKTVKELIYEIKENKTISINDEEVEIQRAINEADILTISIGMDELSEDKITNSIIKEYQNDIKELFNILKKLNNKKIIVLGLYTIKKEEQLNIAKINGIIRDEALTKGYIYIDIKSILTEKEYYLSEESYYINYLGHKKIYKEISKAL